MKTKTTLTPSEWEDFSAKFPAEAAAWDAIAACPAMTQMFPNGREAMDAMIKYFGVTATIRMSSLLKYAFLAGAHDPRPWRHDGTLDDTEN